MQSPAGIRALALRQEEVGKGLEEQERSWRQTKVPGSVAGAVWEHLWSSRMYPPLPHSWHEHPAAKQGQSPRGQHPALVATPAFLLMGAWGKLAAGDTHH